MPELRSRKEIARNLRLLVGVAGRQAVPYGLLCGGKNAKKEDAP